MLKKRQLETILQRWAGHLSSDKDFNYTKWDANLALAIKLEIKEIERQYYEKRKAKHALADAQYAGGPAQKA